MSKAITPMRAVRAHCLECSGGNRGEVARCPITDCSLYRYRMGRNPARSRKGDSKPVLLDKSSETVR